MIENLEEQQREPKEVKLRTNLSRPISGTKPSNVVQQHQITRPLSSVGQKPSTQSQRSVGKAMNNMEGEVPQQVILRPVSGKSNSNRYSHLDAGLVTNRSNERQAYYEDEEDQE